MFKILKRRKINFRKDNLYGRRPEWKITQIAGTGQDSIFS
jgi:hypothetical protein